MTYIPHRRRLLAAFALFAGAPTLLRAQDIPSCETRFELEGGAYMLARFMSGAGGPSGKVVVRVPAEAISSQGYSADNKPLFGPADGSGELTYELGMDDKGVLYIYKITFETPYPGYPAFGFAASSIAIDAKPYGIKVGSPEGGRIKASLMPGSYSSPHEETIAAALMAGARVRLWLEEAQLGGPATSHYAVEVKTPALTPKAAAMVKAMKKLAKDQAAEKCTPISECFLTTAAVNTVGLADDCWELATLRAFRDGPLQAMPGGAALSAGYYDRAPGIVRAISARPDAARLWLETYWTGVVPCAVAARLGLKRLALSMYRRMTLRLERLAAA
jgi:hypothetical protein